MKTKTIITAIILLFSLTSFAQTKEETIAWIKEKLEQYGGSERKLGSTTYSNVQVSPCSISFTHKWGDGEYTETFNPSRAKSWTVGSDEYIIADAQIIQSTARNGEKWSSPTLFIRNGESGIHERMIKALTHLATFCEQKKEAF